MIKKKTNPLKPNATDRCHHENDAGAPEIVRELIHSDGVSIFAIRQCSMCNTTCQRSQPMAGPAIDRFSDGDNESWEPVSKHGAYQAKQAAKLDDEDTDIIGG